MFKFKKLEEKSVARVGRYFSFQKDVYKIVHIGSNGIFFAWYRDGKIALSIEDDTPLETQEGMELDFFIKNIEEGHYKLDVEEIIPKELKLFKLE